MLKLDILPFLPFDMDKTLGILERAGMLHRYSIDGKEYGLIDTFEKHQRLSGKELTEGEKFPSPADESFVKQQGSAGEIPESQEGKGREEEGKGKERKNLFLWFAQKLSRYSNSGNLQWGMIAPRLMQSAVS